MFDCLCLNTELASILQETRVREDKKAKLKSLIELMLCAHMQDDPEEYLRTAKFNRGNVQLVRKYLGGFNNFRSE